MIVQVGGEESDDRSRSALSENEWISLSELKVAAGAEENTLTMSRTEIGRVRYSRSVAYGA
jgi:hypothetical protein